MLPALALALVLATDVSASASASAEVSAEASVEPAKEAKPSPTERLAELDDKRFELHVGARGYARMPGGHSGGTLTIDTGSPFVGGGTLQLGFGVRLVRGLYIRAEVGAGAHAEPVGASASAFLGIHHEFRRHKWVRPHYYVGYRHLVDADLGLECGCAPSGEFSFDSRRDLAHRPGVLAGLGLRFPMPFAPRMAPYASLDVGYSFDDRPGNLELGASGGLQFVF